ncbi:MAG: hypothetical protein JXB32_03470 [Deltaproteobacteria bacterium]|nr:hypothetical protein [Deltaproteobacteria bacterium]
MSTQPMHVTDCLDRIAATAAEEVSLFHAGRRPLPHDGVPSLTALQETLATHHKTLHAEPLRSALDDVCRSVQRTLAWTNNPSGSGMGSPRIDAEADKELTRLQGLVTVAKAMLSDEDGNASLPDRD